MENFCLLETVRGNGEKWVYEESGEPLEASHKFQNKFLNILTGAERI